MTCHALKWDSQSPTKPPWATQLQRCFYYKWQQKSNKEEKEYDIPLMVVGYIFYKINKLGNDFN